jgi:hypothetical protein
MRHDPSAQADIASSQPRFQSPGTGRRLNRLITRREILAGALYTGLR